MYKRQDMLLECDQIKDALITIMGTNVGFLDTDTVEEIIRRKVKLEMKMCIRDRQKTTPFTGAVGILLHDVYASSCLLYTSLSPHKR